MKNTRLLSSFLCLLFLLGTLTGCGASSQGNAASNEAAYPESVEQEAWLSSDTPLQDIPQADRKLIKTVSINAETKTYDTLLGELDTQISALGGYIENRDSHTGHSSDHEKSSRSVSMTVRIPADKLSEFVQNVSEHANVLNTSEQTEDITLQYVDTASRITALETEQARLLELLETAEDLESVLLIEERLSEVNYELESHNAQKRTYDNQVDYATVHLNIQEVLQLTPVEELSFWERISTGFVNNLRNLGQDITNFAVWMIVELPYLLIWAGIFSGVYFLSRKFRRKRKERSVPQDPEA